MPFDGSGNFSRLYNWQSDRDNGIHILASRMDGEFDNFAAGMNVVFFRNGLVPMSGNLNMGQNYITGLGAGSVGALPVRFADDPNSGLFLNGFNKPTLVAGGNARLEANTGGVAVTGTLNSTGALTQNGQQVWHAGNFVPGNYAPLAGANTWTGVNTFQNSLIIEQAATPGRVQHNRTGVLNWYTGGYPGGGNAFGIQLNASTPALSIDTSNNAAFTGTLGVAGAITQAGNQVWHAGNFNPANYAALAGANFTGNIGIGDGSAGNPSFRFANDTDTGIYRPANNVMNFVLGNTPAVSFEVGGVFPIGANTRDLGWAGGGEWRYGRFGTDVTVSNNSVWHAGNFNPANYAPLAGATFTGTVTGPILAIDANAYWQISSGNSYMQFDASDYYQYHRTNNAHNFATAGTVRGSFDANGLTVTGNITKSGAGIALTRGAAGLSATVTQGTAAPSGGSDGDIYLQYT